MRDHFVPTRRVKSDPMFDVAYLETCRYLPDTITLLNPRLQTPKTADLIIVVVRCMGRSYDMTLVLGVGGFDCFKFSAPRTSSNIRAFPRWMRPAVYGRVKRFYEKTLDYNYLPYFKSNNVSID